MDNSIQEIINNLSNEITKLKYRNETNVTMRIDTIIEFLEQLKTDIIGEQQDQKFDLHRTATNCTITILDENDNPITDGSNKLSYGEVIKISVVASSGYENPTLSVNGLPFTSGDTMVVKADLTIEGTATAVAPSLVAFEVNDILSNGDKIHFDTTKGSELATYLRSLSFEGQYNLIGYGSGGSEGLLYVMNASEIGSSGLILFVGALNDFGVDVLYAENSGSFDDKGDILSWNAGFNNLDANGDYTLSLRADMNITSINDTTPPTWNGIIIGKVVGN